MPHISLVTLGVDDLQSATAFYEALGWRRSSASVEGTVTFLHGTPVLALFGRADLAADARLPPSTRSTPGDAALAMNLPTEDDVERMLATAASAGASICKPAERAEWGGFSGYFLDPEGHLWEVAHNPHFPLHPDGRMTLPDG